MEIKFFMAMIPPTATHQEKKIGIGKNGKPYVYEPVNVEVARQKLRDHLAKHILDAPLEGPIRLFVKWCFPISDKKYRNGQYRSTKPDTDNLQKLLKDEMTYLKFWKDDAQVASEIVEKFWADIPGIFIKLEEL